MISNRGVGFSNPRAVAQWVLLIVTLTAIHSPAEESLRKDSPARHDCSGERNSDGSPKHLVYDAPEQPGHTALFDYDDFGPQAAASGLLGFAWWQWAPGGSWEACDRFDVRIVVYRGRTRAQVAAAYPVARWQADYRYVEYRKALAYLERLDADIEGDPSLERMKRGLLFTRSEIIRRLGAPPASQQRK